MPKTTPRSKAAQAKKRVSAQTAQKYRARQAYFKQRRKAERRLQDAELKRILKAVRGKGIYDPKSTTLTKYRRTKARKVKREYGELLDAKQFFFVPVPKQHRKDVRARAPGLELKATKTGLFVAKQGYTRAKLVIGKKTGTPTVKRTGKRKRGPSRTKTYSHALPILPADEVERQLDRIRDAAQELMPLRGNEQIVFIVNEKDHTGYSRHPVNSPEALVRWLQTYRRQIGSKWTRTLPDFINFLIHVEVEKTGSVEEWREEHPPPEPPQPKRRRRRTAYERATRG